MQAARNITDDEMAFLIGTSRAGWQQVRTGLREPSRDVLAGIIHAFPEHSAAVLRYLKHKGRQRSVSDEPPVLNQSEGG